MFILRLEGIKRSPPYEFGVEVKEDGVLINEGDGDIRGFILVVLDLRMLQIGVFVGVRKGDDEMREADLF